VSQELRLSIEPVLQTQLGVYFTLRGAPPDPKSLALEGLATRARGPMAGALGELFARDLARALLVPRGKLPEPPGRLLRAMGAGEEEWRRFEAATHVAFIGASYGATPPPLHHWATFAAGGAVAEATGGVVLDPLMPRLLPLAQNVRPVPDDGRVVIVRDVIAPMSRQDDGTVLITTKGLSRFGLPAEMCLAGIPPSIAGDALPLVNAVAQRFVHELYRRTRAEPRADALVLPDEIRIDRHDLAASSGKRLEGEVAGGTDVRLSLDVAAGRDAFLLIEPPRAFRGERGEWLHEAMAALVGLAPEPPLAHRAAGDEALRLATERARRELPDVRARFAAGLPLGARLFVKRGFQVRGGISEFMWVAVLRWGDERVQGALANDSSYDSSLRAGHAVTFGDDEVTDWMVRHGDGKLEGGYSIAALSQ